MADRRLIDDLNRVVVHPPKQRERLGPAGAPGALPGRGTGKPGDASAGIASPLTEHDYTKRTFQPAMIIESSDGLFTFKLKPVKRIVMTDAGGRVVEFIYAAPPLPAP